MHILYERLTPAQNAAIEAIVSSYTAAVARKDNAKAVGDTTRLAAYLNAHMLANSLICLTCAAADAAMGYAAQHYASQKQKAAPVADKKRKQSDNSDAGNEPNLEE